MTTHDSYNVAVIGAGTIGLSWAVLAANAGHRVTITDPREDLRGVVDDAVHSLGGELPGAGDEDDLLARITLCGNIADAVREADVVHENGPERMPVKQAMFAEIAAATSTDSLLLTSTSGLDPNEISAHIADDASRVLVAHPFNPPHLIPLVEVVPTHITSERTVQTTVAYLRGLGRHPVLIHKVRDGFVANRLQRALFAEAVALVADDVVSVAELDEVVRNSLGIRWATAGPFLSFHLGGGPGGLRHMIDHLMAGRFSDELAEKLITQTEHAYDTATYQQWTQERGQAIPAVITAVATANPARVPSDSGDNS